MAEILLGLAHGVKIFLPVELRREKPRKGRKVIGLYQVPLLPRLVFSTVPVTEHAGLSRFRQDFDDIARDPWGVTYVVPDSQMQPFMTAYDKWIESERTRLNAGGRGRTTKRKWKRLTDANPAEVMRELFGIEQEREAA